MAALDESDRKVVKALGKRLRNKMPTHVKTIPRTGKVDVFSGRRLVDNMLEHCGDLVEDRNRASYYAHLLLKVDYIKRGRFILVDDPNAKNDLKKKQFLQIDNHPSVQFKFQDEMVPYFWVYSITPLSTWLILGGILLAGVAFVTMPVWPNWAREGTQYVSWGGIGLLGLLISLELVRFTLNMLVFHLSGKTKDFWLFPRLNDEDLGFWESWTPLYCLEDYQPPKEKKKKRKSKRSVSSEPSIESGGEDEGKGEAEAASALSDEDNAESNAEETVSA
ncbi:uncharacterized protein MONBRDRAFT_5197 [Monosiga brevicollis MX1]|uniref:Translocation protein SEC62 n=1 Tax=Monosiga brevicollis TaxID=81824 RepID=A9UQ79_MONBE|nr:uncharacterized protein MONBRDRAFT_5197 [Monosiga brevicollis MX1]EDQ92549.1 predicted protein [Monosiga brevicollis MX1]|eukprot:XP_001742311.1 hypothetical protein [Monosiga brevicollis MX1]